MDVVSRGDNQRQSHGNYTQGWTIMFRTLNSRRIIYIFNETMAIVLLSVLLKHCGNGLQFENPALNW